MIRAALGWIIVISFTSASQPAALAVIPTAAPAAPTPSGLSCDNATAQTIGACITRLLTDPQSPYSPTHHHTAAEKAPVVGPRLAALASPSVVGTWQVVADLVGQTGGKANSIHVSLLPTGNVLVTAGSGYNRANFDSKIFRTWVWNPTLRLLTNVPDIPDDLFCAGHMHLADGTVVFFGGTGRYGVTGGPYYSGIKTIYKFDHITNRYVYLGGMNVARWYPTAAANAAGTPIIVGGLNENSVATDVNEIFSASTGQTTLLQGRRRFPLYAGMHLLASGSLFYSGQNTFGRLGAVPGIWRWTDNAFTPVPGLRGVECRDQASSVMLYPAQTQRVMVTAGGCSTGVTGTTSIATLTGTAPKFVDGPWMTWASMYTCALNLPDRSVLVTGGSDHNKNPRLRASVLKYGATAWTHVAAPTVARGYHNSCLLLPDGSVATFGSNVGTGVETRVEIYKPWYMHVARPAIVHVSPTLQLGGTYIADYSGPSKIVDAHLTRLDTDTHSRRSDARQVQVAVSQMTTPGKVGLKVESRWGVLPLGKYMFTLVDARGVPSMSRIVQVVPVPPPSADEPDIRVLQRFAVE